jgi:hypothetical protein
LIDFPAATSEERRAEFASVQPPRPPARARSGKPPAHECRLDDGDWKECDSPTSVGGLSLGTHSFAVRAVATAGRIGPVAARSWKVVKRTRPAPESTPAPVAQPSAPAPPVVTPVPPVEPEEPYPPADEKLRIEADTSALAPLLPGAPPQPLPLTIVNEADEAALITSLDVTVTSPVADCTEVNFEVTPAGISAALPLEVPAEGSVALPAPGFAAPQLSMRELPVNQDPCQGVQLQLEFDAEATG